MAKKIVLRVVVCGGVICGGGMAYASIFGEENITLARQLTELMGIHSKLKSGLVEAREAVDLATDARDDILQGQALIEELHTYSVDRFIEDFRKDVLKTYPDLDYIINETGAESLNGWYEADLGTPMGSYEFIGRAFGEVTSEMRDSQQAGDIDLNDAVQKKAEASADLTAAAQAEAFSKKADQDIEDLVQALSDATKDEAVVIHAKLAAIVAVQNSHRLRMEARQLRGDGLEMARRYRGSMKRLATTKEMEGSTVDLHPHMKPVLLEFAALED